MSDKPTMEELRACVRIRYMRSLGASTGADYAKKAKENYDALLFLIERAPAVDALIEAVGNADTRTPRVQWALDAIAAVAKP